MADTDFGIRVRVARGKRGLSQSELAKMVGVSTVSIQKWESGTKAKAGNLVRLADALDVTIDFLTGKYLEVGRSQANQNDSLLEAAGYLTDIFNMGGDDQFLVLLKLLKTMRDSIARTFVEEKPNNGTGDTTNTNNTENKSTVNNDMEKRQ